MIDERPYDELAGELDTSEAASASASRAALPRCAGCKGIAAMSDYISELRRDLVEAAAREQRRGRAGRVARPLRPRAWSPPALAGALAIAAPCSSPSC